MRQGNGSDLLGLKDPRSTKIGIIYVAPNDDRKSVLAAILTQEKLGRKQIAIILPENQPNKAFQRPQDFDDLNAVRRKLRAQLIFVAPAGPGPAEIARQRRFNVYSSLGSYTDALRAEPSSTKIRKKEKKDRLFGFGKKTAPLAGAAAGGAAAIALSGEKGQLAPIASSAPINNIVENTPNHSLSPYADLPTADLDQQAPQSRRGNDSPLPPSEADQELSTSATGTKSTASPSIARSSVASASGAAAGIVAADLIKKGAQQPVAPDVSSASMHEDWDVLPPAPSASSPQTKAPAASFAPDTTPPSTLSSTPDTPDPTVGEGPGIIELPASPRAPGSRSTGKLPVVGAGAAATSIGQSSATFLPNTPSQGGHGGKNAASAPPGAAIGRPPVRGNKQAQTGAARKRPRSRGLIVALLIVALLLLCGGVAIFSPVLRQLHFGLPMAGNTPAATITITPNSKLEQDSYVIQAVTSNVDSTKRQVSLRQLTFSPQKQSKSVTATGAAHIAAKAAAGQLTFYNGSTQDYWIGSTTAIPGPNGVSVEPDDAVNIPGSHPPTDGTITVNAHATTAGANGNMAAGAINGNCCASGGFITVVGSAFTGGQDQKDYAFLQQSDVDSVVNELKPTLSQQALNGLKSQIKPNEQLASDAQCTVPPNVDQPIGDQGQNVTSANVTINATCTGLAYDATGAQTLAQGLLQTKEASELGPGYVLAGTIMTKQEVTDVQDSVVTLQVAVAGTWYYQFNDQQRQTLAKQLVNKSRAVAQGLLNHYKGVAKASIDIAGGGDILPNDPKQISITVVGVSGASPTNLPALPVIEPTSPSATTGGRG